ncbi:hypothetical protein [Desulforamulus ferrireducens]|uniref:Uncharacterized protein n=1 Tax=Desulforamulus ferrireducens TaxID=1833852 RepID=A0A1S6ITE9_9FIRM|nr:hypothetical protein [Desulforamulus ferrireducens]AQS58048.1 hypothetical protein B0537_02410 [Desulforamulus ferrireducens]
MSKNIADILLKNYMNNPDPNSYHTKIQAYYEFISPKTIDDVFDKENILVFAEVSEWSDKRVRTALVHLHNFAKDNGYISKEAIFPVVNSQINYEKIFRLNNLRWHI